MEAHHDGLLTSYPQTFGKSSLYIYGEARPKCILRGSILEMKSTSVLLSACIVVICVRDLKRQLEFGVRFALKLIFLYIFPVLFFF